MAIPPSNPTANWPEERVVTVQIGLPRSATGSGNSVANGSKLAPRRAKMPTASIKTTHFEG